MNALGEAIGELCKVILPIPEERFHGNPASPVAVCTLSSMDLLRRFRDPGILNQVCVAGRLFSENKGIDSILDYIFENRNVRTIVVCGREVWGHRAGHSLFQLHKNGTDSRGRIINSQSPDPVVASPKIKIRHFRQGIHLENMIGKTDFDLIREKVALLQ